MLNRVSRKLYGRMVGEPTIRRAVALAVRLKDHNGTSVYKDFSYRELSRISGLAPNTCRKRVQTLVQCGLARITQRKGHTYLELAKLRRGAVEVRTRKMNGEESVKKWQPRNADVLLGNISRNSVKEIEKGLMALEIVEIAKRKDFVKHTIDLAHNPKPFDKLKSIKRARKVCDKCGYGEVFVDNGLSYRYLQRRLGCSPNTVSEVIRYGESNKMFTTTRKDWELIRYIGENSAKFALPYLQMDTKLAIFASNSSIWHKPALSFKLIESQTL